MFSRRIPLSLENAKSQSQIRFLWVSRCMDEGWGRRLGVRRKRWGEVFGDEVGGVAGGVGGGEGERRERGTKEWEAETKVNQEETGERLA